MGAAELHFLVTASDAKQSRLLLDCRVIALLAMTA
jgi:hypothetical protein